MGKHAAHPGTTDATSDNPDTDTTRVADRSPQRTTGYTLHGVARRAMPAHRAVGDLLFLGWNPETGGAKTQFVPFLED